MAISGTYQANDAVSFKDCYVEVDLTPSSSSYVAIDSWATEIQASGEDVPFDTTYPFSGNPIVFTGLQGEAVIQCTIVYTEGTDDAFYQIRAHFENSAGDPFDIRWAPAGSSAGNLLFTTSGGKLTACPLPQGAGDATQATVQTFTITADGVDTTVIT